MESLVTLPPKEAMVQYEAPLDMCGGEGRGGEGRGGEGFKYAVQTRSQDLCMGVLFCKCECGT